MLEVGVYYRRVDRKKIDIVFCFSPVENVIKSMRSESVGSFPLEGISLSLHGSTGADYTGQQPE